jgi:glycosyltransferase involved in cell wall biosynthesis
MAKCLFVVIACDGDRAHRVLHGLRAHAFTPLVGRILPMNGSEPELSIIIPAYNEEKRLCATLDRISSYFASRSPVLAGLEIIVVDDGSSDGTALLVRDCARTLPCLRLLSNPGNRGKGYSVRQGMLQARGRIALFTDADLSSPIEECERLFAAIDVGNDVAIGSRALDRSLIAVHQSRFREIAGIIFNRFVRMITQLPIEDTQCGFKAFRLPACRVIFEQQRIAGFGFDPEILFLASRHGLRIAEVPVRWAHDPATKVHVYRDSVRMLLDLLLVRWNSLLGRYPVRRA